MGTWRLGPACVEPGATASRHDARPATRSLRRRIIFMTPFFLPHDSQGFSLGPPQSLHRDEVHAVRGISPVSIAAVPSDEIRTPVHGFTRYHHTNQPPSTG